MPKWTAVRGIQIRSSLRKSEARSSKSEANSKSEGSELPFSVIPIEPHIRDYPRNPRFLTPVFAPSVVAAVPIRSSAKTTQAGTTRKTIHFS
jgi:hypothetical protein